MPLLGVMSVWWMACEGGAHWESKVSSTRQLQWTLQQGAWVPSSNLYNAVGNGRPMSLPTNEDNPTWDMGAVHRPGRFLPPSILRPPLPPAGVLCTP